MTSIKEIYKLVFETQEHKWKTGLGGMIIITILLGVVFNYEANAIEVDNLDELQNKAAQAAGAGIPLIEFKITDSTVGLTGENSESEVNFDIPEEYTKLIWVNCTLTWQDTPSQYIAGTNEPDEFQVTIVAPNNEKVESGFRFNPQDGTGSVTASFKLDLEAEGFKDNYLGTWTIVVEAGDCGDDSAFFPIVGLRTIPDIENDWSLDYTYTYLEKKES